MLGGEGAAYSNLCYAIEYGYGGVGLLVRAEWCMLAHLCYGMGRHELYTLQNTQVMLKKHVISQ